MSTTIHQDADGQVIAARRTLARLESFGVFSGQEYVQALAAVQAASLAEGNRLTFEQQAQAQATSTASTTRADDEDESTVIARLRDQARRASFGDAPPAPPARPRADEGRARPVGAVASPIPARVEAAQARLDALVDVGASPGAITTARQLVIIAKGDAIRHGEMTVPRVDGLTAISLGESEAAKARIQRALMLGTEPDPVDCAIVGKFTVMGTVSQRSIDNPANGVRTMPGIPGVSFDSIEAKRAQARADSYRAGTVAIGQPEQHTDGEDENAALARQREAARAASYPGGVAPQHRERADSVNSTERRARPVGAPAPSEYREDNRG